MNSFKKMELIQEMMKMIGIVAEKAIGKHDRGCGYSMVGRKGRKKGCTIKIIMKKSSVRCFKVLFMS
jgi:hypothetical protein